MGRRNPLHPNAVVAAAGGQAHRGGGFLRRALYRAVGRGGGLGRGLGTGIGGGLGAGAGSGLGAGAGSGLGAGAGAGLGANVVGGVVGGLAGAALAQGLEGDAPGAEYAPPREPGAPAQQPPPAEHGGLVGPPQPPGYRGSSADLDAGRHQTPADGAGEYIAPDATAAQEATMSDTAEHPAPSNGAAPARPPRGTQDQRRWLALAAMLFAVSMTFIDQTIVAIASNNIGQNLHLTQGQVQWGVNSYLLALAATFALGGRLADVIGSKRMVVVGVLLFATSSALCGATPGTHASAEAWLVTFRALQGIGGALMIPAALAVVIAAFSLEERGKAVAIFFGVAGGLTAIGPIAGGFLTQWTWRAVFWVNVPMAVIALVLAAMAHIDAPGRRERIDLRGGVLIAAGMVLSVLGLEEGRTWGWTSPKTIGVLAAGGVVLVAFVLVELRTEQPLIRFEIFRGRAFVVDNLVLFFSNVAFVPVFFFASLYAQNALGFSAQHTGVYLVIFFAGFAPGSQIGGRLLDKVGARLPMTLGAAMSTFGFAFWAVRIDDLDLGAQASSIFFSGAGIGLLLGQASTDAVNRAINASYGEVSGITQTVRNYSAALGIAVLGTVFGNEFAAHTPAGGRFASKVAFENAFALGMRSVLIGMAVALGLCFVTSLFHPGGKVTSAQIGAGPATDPSATESGAAAGSAAASGSPAPSDETHTAKHAAGPPIAGAGTR